MRKGEDTREREMMNLLVWATPDLILVEHETGAELHKEHHSRTAELHPRLTAPEKDDWDGLIERSCRKQEDEGRKHLSSNEREDKEQPYLRRVNRAIL